MCDETKFKLLEQRVTNIDEAVAKSLLLLSESVDNSATDLGKKIDKIEDMLEKKYVPKSELELATATTDAKISTVKSKVELLQKIVYGAVSATLLTVLGALLASVLR